jgi:hypothetical protein
MLFDISAEILEHAQNALGFPVEWSFGGGTALMLQIDHRESHDIDLFLDDPQLLPFLNPETQEIPLERLPDSYHVEGNHVLKLAYGDAGEIDFICCASITESPTELTDVRGQSVALEKAAEIIAKKVSYRGSLFQPRDMFDLAAVTERYGSKYSVDALRQCSKEAREAALDRVQKANPESIAKINSQLMFREKTRHLVDRAQDMSREVLELALR